MGVGGGRPWRSGWTWPGGCPTKRFSILSERNPGYRFERMAKEELVVSPAGGESGRRSMAVAGQLWAWNERRGLGVAFDSSTGFSLPDGRTSLRTPHG